LNYDIGKLAFRGWSLYNVGYGTAAYGHLTHKRGITALLRYLLKRIIAGVLTIMILILVTFFLMHAVPGGPFNAGDNKEIPQETLDRLTAKYGLDKPVGEQFGLYVKNLLQGDLGLSYKKTGTTVNELVSREFPVSARVGLLALGVSIVIGLMLGIVSAVWRASVFDVVPMIFATIGISVLSFVIAVLLMNFFCDYLKILPSFGLKTWVHYILPVACLSFSPIAYIARQTRSSMLDVLEADYIRTARAKGLRNAVVIVKHALKNAIMPVVTYLGPLIAGLLTGSFVTERLFSVPGIGREFVTSISDRDYTVIMGMTIFFGTFVIICNIVVDITYALIDPRVKLSE